MLSQAEAPIGIEPDEQRGAPERIWQAPAGSYYL